MYGLTVRWSLEHAHDGALESLRAHVEDASFARFAGLEGLRFKSWRARPGEWFEGSYVFVDDHSRSAFQAQVESTAHETPGTTIVGAPPILIEEHEVVAVVRGPAGFRSSARFES